MNSQADFSRKFLELSTEIGGTKKRHDAITKGLIRQTILVKDFDRDKFSKYLDNKLKTDEGVILSGDLFVKLFNRKPYEQEIQFLQDSLANNNLNIAAIYFNTTGGRQATLIVVHRRQYAALDFADRIKEAMGNPPKAKALLLKTSVKVIEHLMKIEKITTETFVSCLTQLKDSEIYCISINFCYTYMIDPRALDHELKRHGFEILPLLKHEPIEEIEVYKYYDGLLALMVSRTVVGIEWGKENIDDVLTVCSVAERDLIEKAKNEQTKTDSIH